MSTNNTHCPICGKPILFGSTTMVVIRHRKDPTRPDLMFQTPNPHMGRGTKVHQSCYQVRTTPTQNRVGHIYGRAFDIHQNFINQYAK